MPSLIDVNDVDLSGLSLEQLTVLRTKINTAICGEAGKAIKDAIQGFLNKYPQVYALRWCQYTPYFNDGDPCTFRVCDPYVRFVSQPTLEDDFEEYEDDWGDYAWGIQWRVREGKDVTEGATIELADDLKALNTLFDANEDSMEEIFGGHVEVIVRRGQDAEIRDYNHD
jgi:hypothetical protein